MKVIPKPLVAVIVSVIKRLNLDHGRIGCACANIGVYKNKRTPFAPSEWIADIKSTWDGTIKVWTVVDCPWPTIVTISPADPGFSEKLSNTLRERAYA